MVTRHSEAPVLPPGEPCSLEETLALLKIKSPATLRKLRDLLNIQPIRGRVGSRALYFKPDDIAFIAYVLAHPYETESLQDNPEALLALREKAMRELEQYAGARKSAAKSERPV